MTTETMNGHTNGTAKAATTPPAEMPLRTLRPALSDEANESLDAIVALSKIKKYGGPTPEQCAAEAAAAASLAIVAIHERLMGKVR